MKMMKKTVSLLLLAAMSAGLLAGCAKGGTKEPDYRSSESLNQLLDKEGLMNGKSAKDAGYNWMWIKDEDKVREEDMIFENNQEGGYTEMFHALKKVDWDNDGVDEYILQGGISYSGILFDMTDGVLTAVYGFGPYGMGWNDAAYVDGAYWFYEASGNSGKFYDFMKFNAEHEITDRFCYSESYDLHEDETEEVKYEKGSDYENMSEISEAEFAEMCGENGVIYRDLPELPAGDQEKFTEDLRGAIGEFFDGKRPALTKYAY